MWGGVGTIRKCFGEKKKKEMLFSLLTLVSKKWFRKQTVELNQHLVSQHDDFALLLNITKEKNNSNRRKDFLNRDPDLKYTHTK